MSWQTLNPTNKPGTCLWCGRALRKNKYRFVHTQKLGDYCDGFFCGLRCAYQFAVSMAGFGRRLNPVPARPPEGRA